MVRQTVRWLAVFLILIGLAGGAAVWYAWTRGDELLRVELQNRLEQLAPKCSVRIGRARFDWKPLGAGVGRGDRPEGPPAGADGSRNGDPHRPRPLRRRPGGRRAGDPARAAAVRGDAPGRRRLVGLRSAADPPARPEHSDSRVGNRRGDGAAANRAAGGGTGRHRAGRHDLSGGEFARRAGGSAAGEDYRAHRRLRQRQPRNHRRPGRPRPRALVDRGFAARRDDERPDRRLRDLRVARTSEAGGGARPTPRRRRTGTALRPGGPARRPPGRRPARAATPTRRAVPHREPRRHRHSRQRRRAGPDRRRHPRRVPARGPPARARPMPSPAARGRSSSRASWPTWA